MSRTTDQPTERVLTDRLPQAVQAPSTIDHERETARSVRRRAEDEELAKASREAADPARIAGRRVRTRVAGWLFVLAALAGCAIIAVVQINDRLDARHNLKLDRVAIAADPVNMTVPVAGTVASLKVATGQSIKAGAVVAIIQPDTAAGAPASTPIEIKAPVAGVINQVNAVQGSALTGGAPVASLYQPTQLYFEARVKYSDLKKVRVGSEATINIPGLGKVAATVRDIRPEFDPFTDDPKAQTRQAPLLLDPVDANLLSGVVPGLVVKGKLDKDTGDKAKPVLLSGGRSS